MNLVSTYYWLAIDAQIFDDVHHVERHAGHAASVGGAGLGQSAHRHVLVSDGLHLETNQQICKTLIPRIR